MHSLQRLYTSTDIHDFVLGNWKTDLFRRLHLEGFTSHNNIVWRIVQDFAKLPRFVFSMSDGHKEWAHFSTWWGGIPHRQYENPYIHDLYWIHEMAHAGSMVYVPGMNLENFIRKMTDNELHASVVSEVQIYLEIPELRGLSFPHEIYADRFLADKEFVARYKADPELGFEELKVRRRDTMMDANPKNISDFWIHRFYTQNAAWGACWAHSFDKIETAMSILRANVLKDNSYLGRRLALDAFIDIFLKDHSTERIPFLREAEMFAGVYWGNRGHYDDAMKKVSK